MPLNLDIVYVIGMGEVGRRLAEALGSSGVRVVPVTRTQGWPEAAGSSPGLRLVCVREEALETALHGLRHVPSHRLALIQNGWIRPLLEHCPDATRGLIWFTSKGEFFKQLRASPFTGPAADHLARALRHGGIEAEPTPTARFAALEADKMGFNCVVGLPLAVHGLSLGEYLERKTDEARTLFEESVSTVADTLGVAADPSWWPDFVATVQPIQGVRASAAKALKFRNGAVAHLARRLSRAVPVTERLLAAARAVGG